MTRRHGGNARWPENVDVFMSDAGGAASGVPGSASPPVGAPAGLGAPKAESSPAGKPHGRRMDKGLVILLAVATGTAVASNYYAQPLLPTIRRTFDAGAGAAGLIVTASQIGYAAGLLLLLPLGDLLERRRLVVVLSLVTALGLVGAGLVPNLDLLYVAAVIVGTTTVVGQILVAFAASLASDDERGKVVGTVMSGLFIGILLARTVAGFLGEALGWRGVYYVAGGLALVLAAVLRRALPSYREDVHLSYPAVLLSVVAIFREQPILRRRALYGALAFAAFSVLWTSLAFLLAGPPFHYRSGTIGLFGLVGVAGAVMATVAGRLADRGLQAAMTVVDLRSDPRLLRPSLGGGEPAHRAARRNCAARSRLSGPAHHESERDLPPAPAGTQPCECGLHDVVLRRGERSARSAPHFATRPSGGMPCAASAPAFGAAALALATGERRFGRRLAAAELSLADSGRGRRPVMPTRPRSSAASLTRAAPASLAQSDRPVAAGPARPRPRPAPRRQPPATAGTIENGDAGRQAGVETLQEANVLVGHEQVHKAPQRALLVQQPRLHPGMIVLERRRSPRARSRPPPRLRRRLPSTAAAGSGCGR